jgi:hypothetical protein
VKKPVSKFAFQMRPAALHNGALRFKVSDGYDGSDNVGTVYVAVNSIPTATTSSVSIADGANTVGAVHVQMQLTHSLQASGFNP